MASSLIESTIRRLDDMTGRYTEAFGGLDGDLLNTRPAPDAWSVAQVIDHVRVTNATYFPVFEAVAEGKAKRRVYERMPLLPALFGNLVLHSVSPSTTRKTKTMPVFEPSSSDLPPDLVERFARHQEELIQRIGRLRPDQLHRVITSPASAVVIYPLGKALEIVAAHEERHFLQAGRTLERVQAAADRTA